MMLYMFFVSSLSQLSHFGFLRMPTKKGKNWADLSFVDSRVQFLWFCVARMMSLILLKFGLLYAIMC